MLKVSNNALDDVLNDETFAADAIQDVPDGVTGLPVFFGGPEDSAAGFDFEQERGHKSTEDCDTPGIKAPKGDWQLVEVREFTGSLEDFEEPSELLAPSRTRFEHEVLCWTKSEGGDAKSHQRRRLVEGALGNLAIRPLVSVRC